MIGFERQDGTALRIEFAHTIWGNGDHEAVDYGKKTPSTARTECRVMLTAPGQKREDSLQIGHGNAFCSYLDKQRFTKEQGRQIALVRAVDDAFTKNLISQTERGTLLASYYSRPRGARAQQSTTQQQG